MDLMIERKKNSTTVGEYVYETIKKNIISLIMIPGQQISEQEVSGLLNVSRTPVREAFIKLAKEGLLYVIPQKGTYISHIDLNVVEDIRFIRESLEKAVLGIATKTFPEKLVGVLKANIEKQKRLIKEKSYYEFLVLDDQFHKTIFAGCGRKGTWSFIEQINSEYNRVRMLTFVSDINWGDVVDQHIQILKSIVDKDVKMGQEVMGLHLKKLIFEQVELKEKYPDYFKN